VKLLKTGGTLMLGDFNSPEGSHSRARLQSLVANNIARDIFPTSATFRRDALVESVLDGALVSSQTTYALEAHTVDLVTEKCPVTVSGFPLPCFDDSGLAFEGVFTLPCGSVKIQQFLDMAGNSAIADFYDATGSTAQN
jgi:hypothetical protein